MRTTLTAVVSMPIHVVATLAVPLAAGVFMVATAAATTARKQEDNAQRSRCHSLYEYLFHYEIEGFSHHDTGERMRSEVALELCNGGNTRDGLNMIMYELQRARLPIPEDL